MKQQVSYTIALIAAVTNAAIVDDGLWTGNDWYDEATKIGVSNGQPYSNDSLVNHRITAPLSVDGDITGDYLTRDNVIRVMSIFGEDEWLTGFSLADPVYTFDNFLKAVAKFPAFCGESNITGYTLE